MNKLYPISNLEVVFILVFSSILIFASVLLIFAKNISIKTFCLYIIGYFSNPLYIGKIKSDLISYGPYVSQDAFVYIIVLLIVLLLFTNNNSLKTDSIKIHIQDAGMLLWIFVMFIVSVLYLIKDGTYSQSLSLFCVMLYLFLVKKNLAGADVKDLLKSLELLAIFYFAIAWAYSLVYLFYHGGIMGGRLQTLTKSTEDIGVYTSIFLIIVAVYRDWTRIGLSQLVMVTGFLTLLASGNRASLILFVISFGMISISKIRRGNIFIKVVLLSFLILLLFSGDINRNKLNYGVAKKIAIMSAVDRLEEGGVNIATSNRFKTIWPLYFQSITDNPFGNKGYPVASDMPKKIYPHNLLLFVAYSGGVVAGILFVVWVLIYSSLVILNIRKILFSIPLILVCIGNLLKFDTIRTPNEFLFFISVYMVVIRVVIAGNKVGVRWSRA